MSTRLFSFILMVSVLAFAFGAPAARATPSPLPGDVRPIDESSAGRGWNSLIHMTHQVPTLNKSILENLWRTWEPEYREAAEKASPEERRKMTFDRYGFVEAPYDNQGAPLGYVVGKKGGYHFQCLLCHGGKVMGKPYVGAPNRDLDMFTLYDDVAQLTPLPDSDLVWVSESKGTVNTTDLFAIQLEYRDIDMNGTMTSNGLFEVHSHEDLDIPAWWNVRKLTHIFADDALGYSPRPFMTVMMNPFVSGETIRSWLPEFEDILKFVDTVEPPKYPGTFDPVLASQGKALFEKTCAGCHGVEGGAYPERVIPIGVVGTDSTRLQDTLSGKVRSFIAKSWLSDYGKIETNLAPVGYVAPPLDGVWASAPYFHNGSVPTLYDVLHPSERPKVWKVRDRDGYDSAKMGLVVDAFDEVPSVKYEVDRRKYFDTSMPGKSAEGHHFPDVLTETEKQAVLEYLKTR